MLLILLAGVLLLMLGIIYQLCGRDIFSPSVLFSFSYFLSVICCIWNARAWGTKLEATTFLLIVTAIIFFFLGEVTIKSIQVKDACKAYKDSNKYKQDYIYVPVLIVILVIILNSLLTLFLYKEVVRIANLNFASWGNLIYNFKTNSNNIEGASISGIVTQGLKISKAFAYVFSYIFVNNLFSTTKRKNIILNFVNLIPVFFVVVQSLLKGVRVAIITLLIAIIFMWYINFQIKKDWHWHINIKQIRNFSFILLLVCAIFYYSKDIVGRLQDDMGVVTYVTTYLGGPIELLNLFVKQNTDSSYKIIETMGGLISSLQKIGLFHDGYVINAVREYRSTVTGMQIGNVYGAIRDYYHDFGFLGVPFGFYFISLFVNVMYYKIKERRNYNMKKPSLIIIYSTFVYAIIFLTFSDFLTARLAPGEILEIIFIWIISSIILKKRILVKNTDISSLNI